MDNRYTYKVFTFYIYIPEVCPIRTSYRETPDISEYLDFGFWDRVWYKDDGGLSERKIGRWLGVSHRVGNAMSCYILTQAGKVVFFVQCITYLEMQTSEVQQFAKEYDEKLSDIMKDEQNVLALDNIEQKNFIKVSSVRIYLRQMRMIILRGQNVRNTTRNQHQIQLGTHT